MGASVSLRNVVGVAEHVLLVSVVPLYGRLDTNVIAHRGEMKHRAMDGGLVAIQVFNKRLDAALIFEQVLALVALVDKVNAHA